MAMTEQTTKVPLAEAIKQAQEAIEAVLWRARGRGLPLGDNPSVAKVDSYHLGVVVGALGTAHDALTGLHHYAEDL